jgi:hypothetical protein
VRTSRPRATSWARALAAKADVKRQAKQKVEHAKESVSAKKDDLLGKAKQASPDAAAASAQHLSHKAREHPLPLAAVGGFAFGFLAGRLSNR